MKWEEEGEEVVGHGLHPAVDGVECYGCVGSGHDPFVMWLMQSLVDKRMMKSAMNEVDAEVGEDEEERELKVVVVRVWFIGQVIVEFGVAADFGEEEGDGEDGDPGHCSYGLFNFHADLVLEEFGVFEGRFVEYEDVGE